MEEGLLWAEYSKISLAEKIMAGVQAYRDKFGSKPNRCHVHPSLELLNGVTIEGIKLVSDPTMLPNEFWIGIAEEEECEPQACPGPD